MSDFQRKRILNKDNGMGDSFISLLFTDFQSLCRAPLFILVVHPTLSLLSPVNFPVFMMSQICFWLIFIMVTMLQTRHVSTSRPLKRQESINYQALFAMTYAI